ncbi:MAG: prepilin-type N-terminal cleavage/methylation domain-containing protein [Candidatus Xenobiia bacterium LiM19]
MRRHGGFTMIEVVISTAILFLILPSTFFLAGQFYRHQRYVLQKSELRQSARECAAHVVRDISVNNGFSLRPDNHGLTVSSDSGSITYSFSDHALVRKDGRGAVNLTKAPVRDIVFVQYGSRVVMTITFDFCNINTSHNEACTFIEAVRR